MIEPLKNLIMINGPMGVGKTATCTELKKMLPRCVFLDGDWAWDMSPFVVTDETKEMVLGNIRHLLNSFLACSEFENILFCWVMHEQSILDDVLAGLHAGNCSVYEYSLVCSEAALTARIEADIQAGKRAPGAVEKSLSYLRKYAQLKTEKIDVSAITAEQAAEEIYMRVYR